MGVALSAIGDRGYYHMALRDEIRHQQKKLKGKGVKAHISYFFTYYTWATIGVVCGVAAAAYLIITVVNHKDQALEVIMLNASTTSLGEGGLADTLGDDYAAYAGIDTDTYSVVIDTSTYQTPGYISDTYDMATSQKVSVQAAANALDGIVADASNFYYYTYACAFYDLREVLSEETLERYEEYIYYVDQADIDAYQELVDSASSTDGPMTYEEGQTYEDLDTFVMPDPDEMENPVPVGIVVTDAPVIAQSGVYKNCVVIYGFVQGSHHLDNAASFLDYLWQ